MFQVKICGVRLEQDLVAVDNSGGDAVGFNFFPPSVRYLNPDSDETIALSQRAGSLGLLRVGVFVNETADTMQSIARTLSLDAIQLHGDEDTDVALDLRSEGLTVVRAIKLPKGPFESAFLDGLIQPWIEAECHLILDVDAGAAHGGSGKTLDWDSVAVWSQGRPEIAWTLAGGLKPENLHDAIAISGARSVDTASGVECPRGVKNADRIAAFGKIAAQAGLGRKRWGK